MEEKLLEVKERFQSEFETVFIEGGSLVVEDSFEDTGCKNDDDCYDQALENANRIKEIFPELEIVEYYCHRHKYAICELKVSREYLDSKDNMFN